MPSAARARSSRCARSVSSSCRARATASSTDAGRAADRAALELGVVLDAHPGQHRDLAAAQAGDAPVVAGQAARPLGGDRARRSHEELAHLCSVVHATERRSRDGRRRGALPVHPSAGTSSAPARAQGGGHGPTGPSETTRDTTMRGVVMHAPGDVRVEDRDDPTIVEADRRDHPPRRHLHLRLGPVALPRHRARRRTDADGPRVRRRRRGGRRRRHARQARRSSSSAPSSPPTTPARSAAPATSRAASTASPWAPSAPRPSTLRIPLADGTLVATPGSPTDDLIPSLLAASDVLGTGWFAAVAAEAGPGQDRRRRRRRRGRAARRPRRQAARRRADHRHEPPRRPAGSSPASSAPPTSSTERGDDGVARIKELTDGLGAHSVDRGRRHPGVDDAGHPLHPPRRPRRLRRRLPRRRARPAMSCSSPPSTCTAAPRPSAGSCPT